VTVLVTGATGFVGSHVVDELLRRNFKVAYIARATSNHRWLEGLDVELREGSLYDRDSLKNALRDIDVVIHVAGQIAGKNEADFYNGNVVATKNLLNAIKEFQPNLKRYVHISSQAVTGPSLSADKPVTEADTPKPITAYGRTKWQAEQIVHSFMDSLPCTIVRPPAVYGPRDEATLSFFQMVSKGVAPLIGFNGKLVSLIHVRDLATGIVEATIHPNAVGETYFITSSEVYSWKQISNVAGAAAGRRKLITIRLPHVIVLAIAGIVGGIGKLGKKPPVLNYEKGIDLIQTYWTSSGDKARKELGFRPAISLSDGITDTITWYRKQQWL